MEETFASIMIFNCAMPKRETEMGGFSSHMGSRFLGRGAMSHWVRAVILDSDQRFHPLEREMPWLCALICSLTVTTAGMSMKMQLDADHLVSERSSMGRKMWHALLFWNITARFTCCGAFREGATFLTLRVNYFGMLSCHPSPSLTMETKAVLKQRERKRRHVRNPTRNRTPWPITFSLLHSFSLVHLRPAVHIAACPGQVRIKPAMGTWVSSESGPQRCADWNAPMAHVSPAHGVCKYFHMSLLGSDEIVPPSKI